ncbi:MAG: nuclear transport factor 2 family protein [Pyrinomonadaceae bacterium]
MISKIVLSVLGLVVTLLPSPVQNQGNNRELVIRKMETQLAAALSKGDIRTLDRLLADDYIEIDAQGGVKKKADVIASARLRSSTRKGSSVGPEKIVDEVSIRLRGDHALVIGRTSIRYQFMEYQTSSPPATQNPLTVDQERFIRSYSKVAGRWQLVAWQTTSIAKH